MFPFGTSSPLDPVSRPSGGSKAPAQPFYVLGEEPPPADSPPKPTRHSPGAIPGPVTPPIAPNPDTDPSTAYYLTLGDHSQRTVVGIAGVQAVLDADPANAAQVTYWRPGLDGPHPVSSLPGIRMPVAPAPPAFTLRDPSGKEVVVADLAGVQAILNGRPDEAAQWSYHTASDSTWQPVTALPGITLPVGPATLTITPVPGAPGTFAVSVDGAAQGPFTPGVGRPLYLARGMHSWTVDDNGWKGTGTFEVPVSGAPTAVTLTLTAPPGSGPPPSPSPSTVYTVLMPDNTQRMATGLAGVQGIVDATPTTADRLRYWTAGMADWQPVASLAGIRMPGALTPVPPDASKVLDKVKSSKLGTVGKVLLGGAALGVLYFAGSEVWEWYQGSEEG